MTHIPEPEELDEVLSTLAKSCFIKGMGTRYKAEGNWGEDVAKALAHINTMLNRARIDELERLIERTARPLGTEFDTHETDLILGETVKDRLEELNALQSRKQT